MGKSKRLFRNALGGYRKGDVTAYIEKTASEHRSALLEQERIITALQKENRSLQQQLNLLMMSTPLPSSAPAPSKPEAEPTPQAAPIPKPAPAPSTPENRKMAFLERQASRRAETIAQRQKTAEENNVKTPVNEG